MDFNKKDFNKIYKFLLLTGILFTANPSYAAYNWDANPQLGLWIAKPYFGLEYKVSYTPGQDVIWKRLLPTKSLYSNITVFTGVKFLDFLAGEFGYIQSSSRTKYSDLGDLTLLASLGNPGSKQDITLKYNSCYLDLNGQLPGTGTFSLLGTVGIAYIKPVIKAVNFGSTYIPANLLGNPVLGNDSVSTIAGKSKLALRLGFGAQIVQGIFGIRSRIMWEDASMLRVNTGRYNQRLPNITEIPFKNTFAWTFGVLVRFL